MSTSAPAPVAGPEAAAAPVTVLPAPDHAAPAACRNCDAVLHGPWCAQCGQRVPHHADPTAHELLHDAVHEFLHLDGKIFATVRTLFLRPGELTAEYLRGKRARYISPIRLYLTCSVVYFLVAALVNPVERAVERGAMNVRLTEAPASLVEAGRISRDSAARVLEAAAETEGGAMGVLLRRTARVERDRVGFAREMRATVPKIFFAFVPVFAWILWLVHRRRGNYPAHLYFALHFFSFCFASATVAEVAGLVPGSSFVVGWLLMALWAVYGVQALRRVHGGTLGRTLARAAVITAASVLAFGVVGMAGVTLVFLAF